MNLDELDYVLPVRLLADKPREMRGEERDEGRLLIMHRASRRIEIGQFRDLPTYLSKDDVVVLNNSHTINASCFAHVDGVGRTELQLRSNLDGQRWYVSPRPWSASPIGRRFTVDRTRAGGMVVGSREYPMLWLVEFDGDVNVVETLARYGRPIPAPYVAGTFDNSYYNTVYAQEPGSVEMPAAGRHFTPELLATLADKGVRLTYLTLHTGLSSVNVSEETFEQHTMFEEWYSLGQETAAAVNTARRNGHMVLVVGTTVMRVLESVADENGYLKPMTSWTDLYIYPGYDFKVPDAFITNFHGPRTSRIALAAAFTGKDLLLAGYAKATENEMQFFEFGDATLTLPD